MKKLLLLSLLVFAFSSQSTFAQNDEETEDVKTPSPQAYLFDEFPETIQSEDRSARIDGVINELQNNPQSKVAIVFYCGKECLYGEFEAHIRGIKMKLNNRGANSDKFVFIHGGYRKESLIRVWIVPKNADLPLPESTIKFEDVKFKETFKGKFKLKFIAYDCCDY